MQDAVNANGLLEYAVVGDVLADAEVAQTRREVVPCRTKVRMREEFVDRPHDAIRIRFSLLRSPSRIGVSEQCTEVAFSLVRELELTG